MATYKVGADMGNDSLKVVFGPKSHWTIKNAVSRRLLHEEKRNLSMDHDSSGWQSERMLKQLDVIIRPLGGEEERYYIGDQAIRAGEDEKIVGLPKADNPHIHIPLLAMLGLHVAAENNEGRFQLVCGLPIRQFTPAAREKMTQKLIGDFEVTFMNQEGKRDRKVKVIIDKVTVAPEGVPVLMNQMLNSEATGIKREDLRDTTLGIIDIGAFTTDIPVIVKAKPDSMASQGIDEGIATYMDRIAKALSDRTGAVITRNQIVEKVLKNDLTMSIRGKKFEIRKEIEDQFQIFANKIIDVIDQIWRQKHDIDEFIVVGGGGRLLEPYLRKVMTQRDIGLTFVAMQNKNDFENDPQLQNAFGYWKIAKQRYGA